MRLVLVTERNTSFGSPNNQDDSTELDAPSSFFITMTKPKILVQLDSDAQASVFDGVVAVDSGVDHLFQHASVTVEQVQGLVHGAMFTRGPADLRSTAVFIGGSDVSTGEALLQAATQSFFGPIRVSVMLDASGANTTAAAAVVAAGRHVDLANTNALVLAATGPVGQRVARLLGGAGAKVKVASRSLGRAEELTAQIGATLDNAQLTAIETRSHDQLMSAVEGVELIVAAGAAGIELLPADVRKTASQLKVMIDLNAVPPLGIAGVDVMDKAKDVEGVIAYGAIGVGGTKMKIHKAALHRIFESNDVVLDIDEIYQLGLDLEQTQAPGIRRAVKLVAWFTPS